MALSPSHQPVRVFVSYAHRDDRLRAQLVQHLSSLIQQGIVAAWHDRTISAGSEWDRAIDAQLEAADIILLLVSADFLASTYCTGVELPRAMERHAAGEARVIPIILRPVDWHGAPFGTLQALPRDGRPITTWSNRDQAFAEVAQGVRAVVAELAAGQRSAAAKAAEQDRRFEAAMPAVCQPEVETEVRVMVALATSAGLRAHLPARTAEGLEITRRDVQRGQVRLPFPADPSTGLALPRTVFIKVTAPRLTAVEGVKVLQVPPDRDSGIVTFLLTPAAPPQRARVVVELFLDRDLTTLISSLSLSTEIRPAAAPAEVLQPAVWQLATMALLSTLAMIQPEEPTAPQAVVLPSWSSSPPAPMPQPAVQGSDAATIAPGDYPRAMSRDTIPHSRVQRQQVPPRAVPPVALAVLGIAAIVLLIAVVVAALRLGPDTPDDQAAPAGSAAELASTGANPLTPGPATHDPGAADASAPGAQPMLVTPGGSQVTECAHAAPPVSSATSTFQPTARIWWEGGEISVPAHALRFRYSATSATERDNLFFEDADCYPFAGIQAFALRPQEDGLHAAITTHDGRQLSATIATSWAADGLLVWRDSQAAWAVPLRQVRDVVFSWQP